MAGIDSDKEWEARQDVDTLIKAQEIMDDDKRKKRALVEIRKRNKDTDKAEAQLVAKTGKRIKKMFGK